MATKERIVSQRYATELKYAGLSSFLPKEDPDAMDEVVFLGDSILAG